MKQLVVGIASYDDMKAYTKAIVTGKHTPKRGEPKIWFTSIESFAKVLSDRNRELLALIAEVQPDSLTELSELSGRATSSLTRTLKKMEGYGLVVLKKGEYGRVKPSVPYSDIVLDLAIRQKAPDRYQSV